MSEIIRLNEIKPDQIKNAEQAWDNFEWLSIWEIHWTAKHNTALAEFLKMKKLKNPERMDIASEKMEIANSKIRQALDLKKVVHNIYVQYTLD